MVVEDLAEWASRPRARDLPAELRGLVLRTHELIREANVARKAAIECGDMAEAARLKERKRELRDLAHVVVRDRARPAGGPEDLTALMRAKPRPGGHGGT